MLREAVFHSKEEVFGFLVSIGIVSLFLQFLLFFEKDEVNQIAKEKKGSKAIEPMSI